MYSQPITVDQRSQSALEQYFFNANSQASNFGQKLNGVKQTYQQKHQSALSDLKQFEDTTFTAFTDPKHPLMPLINDTISKINPAFKSNPMVPFVAKSLIAMQFMAKKIAELQTGKGATAPVVTPDGKNATAANKAQAKAGPTASGVASAPVVDKDEVTFDDFEKVKAQD